MAGVGPQRHRGEKKSGWFQKSEDTPILKTVIIVTSKRYLIHDTMLRHKNHSTRSAICIARLSILVRLVNTRELSPTVTPFLCYVQNMVSSK
jgi:hypothetical protein